MALTEIPKRELHRKRVTQVEERAPWFSAYEPEVRQRLDYPDIPLTRWLTESAANYPDREAMFFYGKRIRFRELFDDVRRFAGALRMNGIRPGDRVAVMLPNIPQYVIAYYGILYTGAVVVQTNPLYMERELEHHLGDSGAKLIVCLDLVYPKVRRVWKRTALRSVVVTGIRDYLPFPKNVLYGLKNRRKSPSLEEEEGLTAEAWKMFVAKGPSPETVEDGSASSGETAILQYTGGTTGTPKAAMLTHANLVANVMQCRAWMHRSNEMGMETVLTVVPLFHVYGMTVCMNYAIATAGKMLLIPKFDSGEALKVIHRQKPSIFPGAPTMYVGIIHHPNVSRYDLSSIQCCISGSSSLPVQVKQKFEELTGGKLVEGYGLSEASPVTHVNPIWGRSVAGSIGLPLPDTYGRIVDPQSRDELEANQVGELAVKGPQVMKGYWNRPDETERVLKEGWLLTGDMAYRDAQGYFYIVDRKKDMINAGGFKVFPREVEEVLFEHPAVQEAAVFGVPDDYRGETVRAVIVTKRGAAVTEEELEAFCRERLAAFKIPRQYEFRTELPKTFVGKVLRRALAEEAARGSNPPDGRP